MSASERERQHHLRTQPRRRGWKSLPGRLLQLFTTRHRATEMWRRSRKPLVIVLLPATIVLAVLYIVYRLVDPLPPRHLTFAAGAAGSGYDNVARQYARILARHGVELEIRNAAGALENLALLRNPSSGVQAALTTFGITQPDDADTLYSLGGIFDAAIFIFYSTAELITQFAQFRGKRLAIGMPGTALRSLMLEVLKATDALDTSTHLLDLDQCSNPSGVSIRTWRGREWPTDQPRMDGSLNRRRARGIEPAVGQRD
jgi:hypothetical protein